MAGTVPYLTGLMRRLRSADKEFEEPYTRILFFNPAPAGFLFQCASIASAPISSNSPAKIAIRNMFCT